MKEVPIRRLTTVIPYLTEKVVVTNAGQPIGTYTPFSAPIPVGDDVLPGILEFYEGSDMKEPVKKAIEPDAVKQQPDGRLSKGLGDLPGETAPEPKGVWSGKPVPKPGAKR